MLTEKHSWRALSAKLVEKDSLGMSSALIFRAQWYNDINNARANDLRSGSVDHGTQNLKDNSVKRSGTFSELPDSET